MVVTLIVVLILSNILAWIELVNLIKINNKNAAVINLNHNTFTSYAKINDSELKVIKNAIIPLHYLKCRIDLESAKNEERYEDCKILELELNEIRTYAKENNITL